MMQESNRTQKALNLAAATGLAVLGLALLNLSSQGGVAGADEPARPAARVRAQLAPKAALAPADGAKKEAAPATKRPTTAPAETDEAKNREELVAINRLLTGDVAAALDAGKLDAAEKALTDVSRKVAAYVERTSTPQWHKSVAPLYQLMDRKQHTLNQKLKAAGKPVEEAAKPKVPAENLKEVLTARKDLQALSAVIRAGRLDEAKKTIEQAEAALTKAVADSGAPAWHEALAPTYQLLDSQKTAVERETEAQANKLADAEDEAADAPAAQGGALKVGDKAPDFAVTTVDGKPLGLKTTLKGKWVLVDFWATWCGPCKAEIPNLKDIHKTYGKDERFALVSLSVDNNVREPRAFTKENNMKWHQGFLGGGFDSKVMKAYGVRGIPAIFLIDPEGRIAAVGLRGDAMKRAVAKALAAKPASGTEQPEAGKTKPEA